MNLGIFTRALLRHPKFQAEFFENLFPPTAERGGEIMICFIKIQLENMKITWNISLFIFCIWFVIFLNVMALQFCE